MSGIGDNTWPPQMVMYGVSTTDTGETLRRMRESLDAQRQYQALPAISVGLTEDKLREMLSGVATRADLDRLQAWLAAEIAKLAPKRKRRARK